MPACDDSGIAVGKSLYLHTHRWGNERDPRPPILLLHGSPGAGKEFAPFAAELARDGRRVIAPDFPGFGKSSPVAPSHSILANAHLLHHWLDQQGIDRAHAVGWSNGGGTAMHLGAVAPDRIASITLAGSIGQQRFEGTGVHAIEHAKYAAGIGAFGYLPELIPHFGALGTFDSRVGWLRNFAHSDQRKIDAALDAITNANVPVLIIHGRDDRLVPVASAIAMHQRLPSSELHVLDADHFLPFTHKREMHDLISSLVVLSESGVRTVHKRTDVPRNAETPAAIRILAAFREFLRSLPWWAHALVIALLARLRPFGTCALAAICCAIGGCDVFVSAIALLLGAAIGYAVRPSAGSAGDWSLRLAHRPIREGWRLGTLAGWGSRQTSTMLRANGPGKALCVAIFIIGHFAALAITFLVATLFWMAIEFGILKQLRGWVSLPLLIVVVLLLARFAHIPSRFLSLRGVRWLRISLERATRFEYWPWYAYYFPAILYSFWLGIKHRGYTLPSACNPGIERGGGIIGESKHRIMQALGTREAVLPTHFIPKDAPNRQRLALDLARTHGIALPFVLKPDSGQRGFAFRVARGEGDVARYMNEVTGDVVLQPFADMPKECGILWIRNANANDGSIYSITAKEFPCLTGDGARTLEEAIETHPRFRRQHKVFLERWKEHASLVLQPHASLRLSESGNHCQGTLFLDGAHLITPELSRVINELAINFGKGTPAHGGLDIVRFDVRYESDASLRAGKSFKVLEMNGTSAESTNIYDPSWSIFRSQRVMLRQLAHVYELGAERRNAGTPTITLVDLWNWIRGHVKGRTGSEVSD